MSTRTPPSALDPATALPENRTALDWQSYDCELVTPMYGGGVIAGEVDEKMPIRASAIRGQLRFWWRLLAKHKYGLSPEKLRASEFDLWGGLGEKEPKASKVWVRVFGMKGLECSSSPESWAKAAYALFPAQAPTRLAQPGLCWQLQIGFTADLDAEKREKAIEALRWWASFGGVGARTRRGLGAVKVSDLKPVSEEEVEKAGCEPLRLRSPGKDAVNCWQDAVQKLKTFRQGENVGRNPRAQDSKSPAGRSRWPEADAVRRISGQNSDLHQPKHIAGNLFPRAAFGLPIIFHFRGKGEPPKHTLKTVASDRMASPLILKPYLSAEGKWHAAALLLPHRHLDQLSLKLNCQSVTYWDTKQAQNVRPIHDNQRTDTLSAFMEFFVK